MRPGWLQQGRFSVVEDLSWTIVHSRDYGLLVVLMCLRVISNWHFLFSSSLVLTPYPHVSVDSR